MRSESCVLSIRNILIVKTSSLGDIVHTFPAISFLRKILPDAAIDWAVMREFAPLVASHPFVRRAISLELKSAKGIIASVRELRKESYDLLFDVQGNCKSGLVTLFAKAKDKVGFGFRSAREWPNGLATNHRFDVDRKCNIRLFNLELFFQFFGRREELDHSISLKITPEEEEVVRRISGNGLQIMVCPGSRWPNKQLKVETFRQLLWKIGQSLDASFFCMWGSEEEKRYGVALQEALPDRMILVDKLSLPSWQHLIGKMDLLIGVDSSALHLCGTTATPSFSLFGPTAPEVFKPLGDHHFAVRGSCPYNEVFEKQCPHLRTCPTGACIRDLKADELFKAFERWWLGIAQK